jgi:hypothetical protein
MTTTKVKNVISVTDSQEAGAICWWRLSGEVSRQALAAAWEEAGLAEDLLPVGCTPGAALRRAIVKFSHGRQMVRPLGDRLSFAIVVERVTGIAIDDGTEQELAYETIARVSMGEDDKLVCKGDPKICAAVTAGYEAALGTYDANDISMWMSGRLLPYVQAVSLRDKGGIYFVPRATVDTWRAIVGLIRGVSAHTVFEVPAMSSNEAVAAILDAISREAQEAAEAMETELIEQDLSAKVLRNRVVKLDKVAAKVATYEALLGTSLDALRARLEALNAQMAAAIFSAEAADTATDEAA